MAYPKELSQWASNVGVPVTELQKEYDAQLEALTANHPDWDEKKISGRATKIVYNQTKALKRSRAKPWDVLIVGVSGVRDMNSKKRRTLLERFNNPDTREEAITGFEGARIKLLVNEESGEGTPIVVDTREIIKYTRDGQERSFKNREYGKELAILPVRDIVGIGMPSFDDDADLVICRISAQRASAEGCPDIGSVIRTRLNPREVNSMWADLRTAAVTKWTNVIEVDWEILDGIDPTTPGGMYELLGRLPAWMQVSDLGEELDDFHEANKDDFGRACVVTGDAAFVSQEPNSNGSYQLAVEDGESFDMDAESTQGFVPAEVRDAGFLHFDSGTHLRALVRTNKSPAWDSENNRAVEPDEDGIQEMRIQFNYLAIGADPEETVDVEDLDDNAEAIVPEG